MIFGDYLFNLISKKFGLGSSKKKSEEGNSNISSNSATRWPTGGHNGSRRMGAAKGASVQVSEHAGVRCQHPAGPQALQQAPQTIFLKKIGNLGILGKFWINYGPGEIF